MNESISTIRPQLSAEHRAQLHASGINDEMIDASGMYTVRGEAVVEILGWKRQNFVPGSGLVFPFRGPDGTLNGYARVKLDAPRRRANGKVIKYESPRNQEQRAYLPPGFERVVRDASARVLVTEGEKKSLAAMQRGFPCIGLVGVWGFQERRKRTDIGQKYGERRLVADLQAILWARREVIIAFDSDAATNRSVRLAQSKLAEVLSRAGAEVRVLKIPPGHGGTKVGMDDYLVAQGEKGLVTLIDSAEPAETPEAPGPLELARALVEDQFTISAGRTLQWHRNEFFQWDQTE